MMIAKAAGVLECGEQTRTGLMGAASSRDQVVSSGFRWLDMLLAPERSDENVNMCDCHGRDPRCLHAALSSLQDDDHRA